MIEGSPYGGVKQLSSSVMALSITDALQGEDGHVAMRWRSKIQYLAVPLGRRTWPMLVVPTVDKVSDNLPICFVLYVYCHRPSADGTDLYPRQRHNFGL